MMSQSVAPRIIPSYVNKTRYNTGQGLNFAYRMRRKWGVTVILQAAGPRWVPEKTIKMYTQIKKFFHCWSLSVL